MTVPLICPDCIVAHDPTVDRTILVFHARDQVNIIEIEPESIPDLIEALEHARLESLYPRVAIPSGADARPIRRQRPEADYARRLP